MSEPFFVKMENVDDIRINLLESSKLALHSMRIEEKLNSLKEEKLKLNNILKEQLKEIILLSTKLEECLPHKELFVEKKVVAKTKKGKKAIVVEKKVVSKNVDKIAQALSDIEKKLSMLR
ncbi:MAG: hypothetical protein PHU51_01125 [Candidatus Nanoarchaeia archaeon]|jgi:hypothetical protein|nr:hypothetical protein [Candidatus Nanoarchaeia archaeon]